MMTKDVDTGILPFADSVWTASTPVRFAGTWFPHVMAIVRLANGELLLHSPCHPSDDLIEQIARIGRVAHVVAPNWFHDLYLSEYRDLYPNATFWAPKFLRRQRRRIIDAILDGADRPPWSSELPYLILPALFTFDECVFFHSPSRTLIVADLLMNVFAGERTPFLSRVACRVFHLDGTLTAFQLLRCLSPWKRAMLRSAVVQMLEWNPLGLIVGHGRPTTDDVSAQIRSAFSWLNGRLETPRSLTPS